MDIENKKEKMFCRGCLLSENNMKSLEEEPYDDVFVSLTNIKIIENDSKFNWLCMRCSMLFYRLLQFKEKALIVDKILHDSSFNINDIKNITKKYNIYSDFSFAHNYSCCECSHFKNKLSNDIFRKRQLNFNNKIITNFNDEESYCDNSKLPTYEKVSLDCSTINNISNKLQLNKKHPKNNLNVKNKKVSKYSIKRKKVKIEKCKNISNIDKQTNSSLSKHKDLIAKNKLSLRNLDMTKIKIINLSTEEQLQEVENRKNISDYNNAKYKCGHCFKPFPSKNSLDNHMKRHDKMFGNFECNLCHQRFTNKHVLKYHLFTHSRRFCCILCNKQFHFKSSIVNHILRHNNKFVCRLCGHESQDKVTNKLHKKIHSTSEVYKCNICPTILSNKYDYSVHVRRHLGDVPFSCIECGKGFQTSALLNMHKTVHSNIRNYYCALCDVSFKTKDIMLIHFKKSIKHIDPALLKYECNLCPKKFEFETQRDTHIDNYHLRHTKLACDICPAQFVSASGLRNHRRRTHEGVKPSLSHVCETCGRGFSAKALLTNHLRTHTGEQPYECETCQRRFSQKSSMQTHIKLVHLKIKRNLKKK